MNETKSPGTLGKIFRTFRAKPKIQRPGDAGPATEEELGDWIAERVSRALEIAPEQLDRTRPLSEYGLDSRAAVSLAGDLEKWLSRSIDVTLAWDHPTVNAMASHLAERSSSGVAE